MTSLPVRYCRPLIRCVKKEMTSLFIVGICKSESQMASLRYCQHLLCKDRDGVFFVGICLAESEVASLLSALRLYFQHLLIRVRSGIFIFSICLYESVASLLLAFAYQSQKWHRCFASICLSESKGTSLLSAFAVKSCKFLPYCQHLLCKLRNGVLVASIRCPESDIAFLLSAFAVKVNDDVFIVSI